MQLAPSAPGFARSIVRIGPCAHWSEVNGLLERLRTLPQLAALDVAGIQDGVITLDVCGPAALPLRQLIAAALPATCSLSVRPAAEEAPAGAPPAHANGGGQRAPLRPTNGDDVPPNGVTGHGLAPVEPADGHSMYAGPGGVAAPAEAREDERRGAQPIEQAQTGYMPDEAPQSELDAADAARSGDAQGRAGTPLAAALGARLLVALDGSRLAEDALSYVAGHFDAARTEVHLMSVVDQAEAGAMQVSIERSPAASYRRLYLRACAQDLRGFRVRCVVAAHAAPAEALLAYAARNAIDLLVMTAHGHRRHADPPLGSVAETVVAKRRLPVLVLPGATLRPGEAPALPGGTAAR